MSVGHLVRVLLTVYNATVHVTQKSPTEVRCRYGMSSFPASGQLVHGMVGEVSHRHSTCWMQTKALETVCRRCTGIDKERTSEEFDGPYQLHWPYRQHQVHLWTGGGQTDPIFGHSLGPPGRWIGETFGVPKEDTHCTDQYLNFSSHHPLNHKLVVIRTYSIVSEEDDRKKEEHIATLLNIWLPFQDHWQGQMGYRGEIMEGQNKEMIRSKR